jgi:hypothetical protein
MINNNVEEMKSGFDQERVNAVYLYKIYGMFWNL